MSDFRPISKIQQFVNSPKKNMKWFINFLRILVLGILIFFVSVIACRVLIRDTSDDILLDNSIKQQAIKFSYKLLAGEITILMVVIIFSAFCILLWGINTLDRKWRKYLADTGQIKYQTLKPLTEKQIAYLELIEGTHPNHTKLTKEELDAMDTIRKKIEREQAQEQEKQKDQEHTEK